MIKPVDEIPMSPGKTNYRDMIYRDILEAIKKNVHLFEFVGNYNFKTLAATAREVARNMVHWKMKNWLTDNLEYKEIRCFDSYDESCCNLITIYSVKGEKEGERRVFCEIDPDMEDTIRKCADMKLEKVRKARERNGRNVRGGES